MKLEIRHVTSLPEALGLAPRLDASAALFHAQISDAPFPAGASTRLLKACFDQPETVLVGAFPPAGGAPVGVCLVAPFKDPLTRVRTPMVLALDVEPDARHRGVARALIEEAQAVLARRGLTVLAARATHNDDALISMGERWGFVRAWELMLFE